MMKCHEMISQKKTTIAVLRQMLGLSVEDFGKLIDKSVSTVTKLENGMLKLSEETAQSIWAETGVDMAWLLADKPKEEPYFTNVEDGKSPYSKDTFERVRAAKQKLDPNPRDAALYLAVSDSAANDWHSVYAHAHETGNGHLALYLFRRFLDGLVERLGKDDEEFLRINQDARRVYANGSIYALASAEALELKGMSGVVLTRVGGPVSVR
jgi:transcriptional regulator with XRE-family HTH domain